MEDKVQEVADYMFELIKQGFGKKNYKAGDLRKASIRNFGKKKVAVKKQLDL